ncbi:MAG: fimbrial protein [Limnobaculum xujianqingii]
MKNHHSLFSSYPAIAVALITLFWSSLSEAQCRRVTPHIDSGCDSCGLGLGLGKVNITDNYLQPVGTPLGSSVVNFTSATKYPDPNKVLYQCDLTDKDDIYEVFATNGDDRVGGYYEQGVNDGYPGYYATYIPYVAIKLTHLNSGIVFSRTWQSAPLTNYEVVGDKINIRVRDLSPVRAELIKISTLPGRGKSNYCGYSASNPLTGMASTTGPSTYTCIQPNGYILFSGPGIAAQTPGTDSADEFGTWGTGRWNAMGMGTAPQSTITYTATCVARNVTPLVIFPTISAAQLNNGETVQSNLNIAIECSNSAVSGVATGNTAMGLQTSLEGYNAAQQLGLVNNSGGVSYLLSSGYGTDSSIATGVGIRLQNASTGVRMNFLGWTACTSSGCPSGDSAGWYPVLAGASSSDSNASGYNNYTTTLQATLEKLPGKTATAGKVDATAYVLVKVQ